MTFSPECNLHLNLSRKEGNVTLEFLNYQKKLQTGQLHAPQENFILIVGGIQDLGRFQGNIWYVYMTQMYTVCVLGTRLRIPSRRLRDSLSGEFINYCDLS